MEAQLIQEKIIDTLQFVNQTAFSIQKAAILKTEVLAIEDLSIITGLEIETLEKLIVKGVIPFSMPKGLNIKFFKNADIVNWLLNQNQ